MVERRRAGKLPPPARTGIIARMAAMALHEAVRALQRGRDARLVGEDLSEAARIVYRRVQNVAHGREYAQDETLREDLIQQTMLRVLQAASPLRERNDGAATLYLTRTYHRLFLNSRREGRAVRETPLAREPARGPADRDDQQPTPESCGPEERVSLREGWRWAWRELFERIAPDLGRDAARGMDELHALRSGRRTMDDLLAAEGVRAHTSRMDFRDARNRIYQRHSRAVRRVVALIEAYSDPHERYFLHLLMTHLRRKK